MRWVVLISSMLMLCESSVLAMFDTFHVEQDGITITVTLDPTNFVVGDIVALHIQAVASDQKKLAVAEVTTFGSFTLRNQHNLLDIPDGENRTWIWSMELDTFDAQATALTGVVIDWIDTDGSKGSIAIDPIPVEITSIANGSLDEFTLRDVKGVVPLVHTRLWPMVTGVVLFLAFVTWLIWKSTRKPTPIVLPHERALRELDALRSTQLEVLPFYTLLSDIVRRYVEARFLIAATGQTTGEFLIAAQQHPHIERVDRQHLRSFLMAADLVKFAQYKPTDQTCQTSIDDATHFITATTPTCEPTSMEHAA